MRTPVTRRLRNTHYYTHRDKVCIDVDPTQLDSNSERINVSQPRFVLRKIDAYVTARHETRSGFLARAALEALAHA
jgi:hypothetical protein